MLQVRDMPYPKVFRGALACLILGSTLAAERPPNIILIMADDMGHENLSCYGSKVYQTPHLDALAASGIRFANAHSQPICTPSRVQIMTGIHNNRNYVRFAHLDTGAVTFANLLRDAGYATAIGGKWQLAGDYAQVGKFGFDRHCLWQLNRKPSRYPNPGFEIDGERKDFKNGEFGPDVVTGYLGDFIRRHKSGEQPFFVYYPMLLPHWPFVPTPDHPDWDPAMWRDAETEPGGYRSQKYWDAFVRYTDKMVGRLLATLDETGQRENTLVIWTADNGTYTEIVSEFDGRPYRGGKGSTQDSGTHVGFIASWPGVIRPGQVSDALVDFTDVLPTLTEAAGAVTPGDIDGVSLMPVFQGRATEREKETIYCWYERGGGREKASQHVRDARYKLYATGRFHDTRKDPEEKRDLAGSGVPVELTEVHAKLKNVLDRQMAVTRQADPVQKAKQRKLAGK
jgi:arylsulfatase A